jgi:phasin family protein
MATAKTPDFTKPFNEAIGEFQSQAKAAYEKSTEALTEATEFAKGNVEAIVESGKIFAGGAQDLGKTYVEEAKSAYETFTADFKEFAAVKSPTELFQLQGKIARRNFDAMVAASSKNTEAMIKLTSEAFAPISGRVNIAAEKITKAAA